MAHEKINGCVVVKDLHYSVEDNTWAKVNDDGTVTIGMTDVAQSLAGPILHAKAKGVGTARKKGRPIATVESGKWVGPVKSPIAGEIVALNEGLASDAQLINRSPYKDGWVVKMKPDSLEADLAAMTTGDAAVAAYKEKIERDNISCSHIEGT
ncbi:MAG: glycine cleavage system protein GcvH, partial [Cyclobacteriaceae bacterium]|nr:glycine cleavage system protein GcvH [Cyclobacteriaceae bacterium]